MALDPEPLARNNPAPDADRKTDSEPGRANNPIQPNTTATPQDQPTSTHSQLTRKTEKDWWDKTKPFLELAGLILLAIYTSYTIRMYCANRQAANAAESAAKTAGASLIAMTEQFRLDQRAWVGLDNPHIELDNRGYLSLAFRFVNSGKTAAKNVQTRVNWEPPTGVMGLPRHCGELANTPVRNAPYIPPQSRFILREPAFDPAVYEDVEHNYWSKIGRESWTGTYLCIFGEIIYHDVNDKRHFTHFCVYASKDSVDSVGYCDKFNDLD